MRGKLLILGGAALIGLYLALVPDPLNDTASFIVAGLIPGTDYMIGPWLMIGLGLLACYGILRVVESLKLRSLEYTAKKIRAEKLAQEFKESNSGIDAKRRAVIAAPQTKSIL